MNVRKSQQGATLLISLIMLMVVTILVVYSIRSGNTNLRIAGNMQYQEEAFMGTQMAIEKVIEQIKVVDNVGLIQAQTTALTMGGVTYNVTTAAMNKCLMEVPILNSDLDPKNTDDQTCYSSQDSDGPIAASGSSTGSRPVCTSQRWEIQASVTESTSGASLTQVQGVSLRVPSTTTCL